MALVSHPIYTISGFLLSFSTGAEFILSGHAAVSIWTKKQVCKSAHYPVKREKKKHFALPEILVCHSSMRFPLYKALKNHLALYERGFLRDELKSQPHSEGRSRADLLHVNITVSRQLGEVCVYVARPEPFIAPS